MEFKKKTLKQFIDSYKSFNVPYYQRNYIWSKDEHSSILIKFTKDIVKAFENGRDSGAKYYIGNLAVCNRNVVDIVDGQQRLTSLVILLTTLMTKYTSASVKNKINNILGVNKEDFIIEDNFNLTTHLKALITGNAIPNAGTSEVYKANSIITKTLNDLIGSYDPDKFDAFAEYVLENIELTHLEFNNSSEAYQYFLNINSFSAPLTETEIFYSFIENVIILLGLNQNVRTNYVSAINKISEENTWITEEEIIDMFLRTYFKNDSTISELGKPNLKGKKAQSSGVGRWIIINQDELIKKPGLAKSFIDNFQQYLIDIKEILDVIRNRNVNTNNGNYKHIYLGHLLNHYTGYSNVYNILLSLFKNRNDYNTLNFYKQGNKSIDYSKVETFFKLTNATFLVNLVNGDKYVEGLDINTISGKQVKPILNNMIPKNVLRYNYFSKEDLVDKNTKIDNNDKDRIKLLLSIQQAYLTEKITPNNYMMNDVLYELLNGKFTIEHLISVKEYRQPRLGEWNNIGKFNNGFDFDRERSSFINLSLLSGSINSALGADKLSEKIGKYDNASYICQTNEPESLIQTLVPNGNIYSNPKFIELGLPERQVKINANGTWLHSDNNEKFILELLERAIKELFK